MYFNDMVWYDMFMYHYLACNRLYQLANRENRKRAK